MGRCSQRQKSWKVRQALQEADVAVIGYGPVGATAANLLGMYGLKTLVFERETIPYHLPRAAHFDDQIMRIFQSLGLVDEIAAVTRSIEPMQFVRPNGELLFQLPPGEQLYGFPGMNMFYQPRLEAVLRTGVKRFPNVTVHLGCAVETIEQDKAGVTLHVHDGVNGTWARFGVRYVLGCDGARSITRKAAGIALQDLKFEQPWLVVDTLLKEDISLPECAQQICDPARPSTYVPSAHKHRRWEFMLVKGETHTEMEQPTKVQSLLSQWVDPDKVEVVRAVVYTFHALLAEQWRDSDGGRLLLVGDAAHQMPPFMGQGMCSGIRDAQNVCWKLSLVLQGKADPSLLATYQQELRPQVKAIITAAIRRGRFIQAQQPLATLRDLAFRLQKLVPLATLRNITFWLQKFVPRLRHNSQRRKPLFALEAGILIGGQRHEPYTLAGTLFPQPRVRTLTGVSILLDEVLGQSFALLGYNVDPRRTLDAVALSFWGDLSTHFVTVVSPENAFAALRGEHAHVVYDVEGVIAKWFGQEDSRVAIIRPDRYVFGVFGVSSLPVATAELQAMLGGCVDQIRE
jgi:3-(3-hydroxy-phenyl)propionate hydroxylase